MRNIGHAANFLANAIVTVFVWAFQAIMWLFLLLLWPQLFIWTWGAIDRSHLLTLSSILGIAGLVWLGLVGIDADGHRRNLRPALSLFGITPRGGGGKMRSASRDDLRDAGLLKAPRP